MKKKILEQALKIVAQSRNSDGLIAYCIDRNIMDPIVSGDAWQSVDFIDDSEKREAWYPIGLGNIGNTCYLNALIQFYFSIRTIRDVILNFKEGDGERPFSLAVTCTFDAFIFADLF